MSYLISKLDPSYCVVGSRVDNVEVVSSMARFRTRCKERERGRNGDSSLIVFTVMRLKGLKLAGHLAFMRQEMHIKLRSVNLKGRGNIVDLSIDGRLLFVPLRVGTRGGHLPTRFLEGLVIFLYRRNWLLLTTPPTPSRNCGSMKPVWEHLCKYILGQLFSMWAYCSSIELPWTASCGMTYWQPLWERGVCVAGCLSFEPWPGLLLVRMAMFSYGSPAHLWTAPALRKCSPL
jgi:hypothetical protein